ncbi:putative H(+)/hexose cotransporter 1, partial [Polypedilum vanderplanki]
MTDLNHQYTKKWPQYLAGAAASGGALVVGTALGWPAPLEGKLLDDQEQGFEITPIQWDWIGSVLTIGCAISCLPIGFLMNKFGRKWTMLGLVIPFLIGWAFLIWAQNFAMLLIGRLFIGLAGGAFCISAPLYSAEIAEKEIRGIIGTLFQLLLNLGILFVYCIGPYLSVLWTNVTCALLAVVFGIIFFFMPESPVYLIIKNREDEAKQSYKWLRGESFDPDNEIKALKDEIAENERNRVSFREVMRLRASKMAVFIGFGLVTFFQMSGINVVIFYSTRIFREAEINMDENISTIII